MSVEQASEERASFTPGFQPDTEASVEPDAAEREFRQAVIEGLRHPDESLRTPLEPDQTFSMAPEDALYDGEGGALYGIIDLGDPGTGGGGARAAVMRQGDTTSFVLNGLGMRLIPGGEPVLIGRHDNAFGFNEHGQTGVSRAHVTVQMDVNGVVHIGNRQPTYGTVVYARQPAEQPVPAEAAPEDPSVAEEPEKPEETPTTLPEAPQPREVDMATILRDPGEFRRAVTDQEVDPTVQRQLMELARLWRDIEVARQVNALWDGSIGPHAEQVRQAAAALDHPMNQLQEAYEAARRALYEMRAILYERSEYIAENLPGAQNRAGDAIGDIVYLGQSANRRAQEFAGLIPDGVMLGGEFESRVRRARHAANDNPLNDTERLLSLGGHVGSISVAGLPQAINQLTDELNAIPSGRMWSHRLQTLEETIMFAGAANRNAMAIAQTTQRVPNWFNEVLDGLRSTLQGGRGFDVDEIVQLPPPPDELAIARRLALAVANS